MALVVPASFGEPMGIVQAAIFRAVGLAVCISPFIFGLMVRPMRRAALELQREHQTILNDISEGVVVVDSDGRIVESNSAARNMFEFADDGRFRPGSLREFMPDVDSGTPARWAQQGLNESTLRCSSGNIREVEFTCRPLSREGLSLFVLVLRDVSERKALEREWERKHRALLEASRMAGMAEIATGVLHNVGNVLNGISVSTGLIRDRSQASALRHLPRISQMLRDHATDLPGFLASPQGQDCIELIHSIGRESRRQAEWMATEIDALNRTLNHALAIIQMQQDAATNRGGIRMVDVQELLENAVSICDASLQRHGVEIVRDYKFRGHVRSDHTRLLQILINLIGNAKHAFAGISTRPKIVTLRTMASADEIIIEVEDNGRGIPAELLPRIFDFGFTTDGKTNCGFGLHSCACLATELGARVSATSDGEGWGACFRLSLPTREESLCPA